MSKKKYGWKRQLPDFRDRKFAVNKKAKLPVSIDLRNFCPPPYDQLDLGSCTGNALAGAFHIDEIKQNAPHKFIPSRLFIYYFERVLEGTVKQDAGAAIRDGIKVLNKQGVCSEAMWPYNESKFTVKPTTQCVQNALTNRISQYQSIDNSNIINIKSALNAKYPVVFGFTVYESFESDAVAQTGIMPMPSPHEAVLGGHAVCAVGYNDATQRITVRNSWGAGWGDKGYFYMPYAYITNTDLCDDFWAIDFVPVH